MISSAAMFRKLLISFTLVFAMVVTSLLQAAIAAEVHSFGLPDYKIQPGDILSVSVWREPDMQLELMVRPDGGISVPLIGNVVASGSTVDQLSKDLAEKLKSYMPDLSIVVAVKQPLGNKIYIIGKVNKPGEFIMNRQLDVMQALSMAGGTSRFASLGDIKILRRFNEGQIVYPFDYEDIEDGKNLDQNIILLSGDVVVVP